MSYEEEYRRKCVTADEAVKGPLQDRSGSGSRGCEQAASAGEQPAHLKAQSRLPSGDGGGAEEKALPGGNGYNHERHERGSSGL